MDRLQSLTDTQFWLLGTAASLIIIHVTLANRLGDQSFLMLSFLFWFAASSLVWQKRDRLDLTSRFFPSFIGWLPIVILLIRSLSPPTLNFLGVYPFVAALGLGLLASGFTGLWQYREALVILFSLGVPKAIFEPLIDISILTAKFATAVLWYFGQSVSRQGTVIALPEGAINVNSYCSGQDVMFYLLGLSVLALLMYPLSSCRKWLVPFVGVLVAFVVNGLRIVLMALLINAQKHQAFDYWHHGHGSLIFSFIAVTTFGLFYLFLLRQEPLIAQESTESNLS